MNETDTATSDAWMDTLLTSWSHEHEATPETLDRLHGAITGSTSARSRRMTSAPKSATLALLCSVAASLFFAALVFYVDSNRTDRVPLAGRTGRDARSTLAVLWKETGRLFGSDLAWIGDVDGELLLGVEDSKGPDQSAEPVYVQLTLREFDAAHGTWVSTWTGKFACRTGSTVDFATADQRTAGSIWVQSRPNGSYAVSHWLNWQDHPEFSGSVDATVSADKLQVVAEGMAAGHKIQIVQQVWRPDVG